MRFVIAPAADQAHGPRLLVGERHAVSACSRECQTGTSGREKLTAIHGWCLLLAAKVKCKQKYSEVWTHTEVWGFVCRSVLSISCPFEFWPIHRERCRCIVDCS